MTSNTTFDARALLLGRITYGEADLIVHLFTDTVGKVSALARGARRSQKRFGGSLEPMHTLRVEISETPRGDLHTLKGASLAVPRPRLTEHLGAMTAAGTALSWVKKAAPDHTPDVHLWRGIEEFLDRLSSAEGQSFPDGLLTGFGLRLLDILGWGQNLVSCVSCGRPCPEDRPSWLSPERGGLVCRACGGGPLMVSSKLRSELAFASQDDGMMLSPEASSLARLIVDRALGAHMGVESRR